MISPSNGYSGLISFRIDWLAFPAVQGTLESFQTPQFQSIKSLALSLLYGPTVTTILEKPWLWLYRIFRQSNVSGFLIR